MKIFLSGILTIITIFSLCVPVLAVNDVYKEDYSIIVNDKIIDLSDLPITPYQEGTTLMVPLRKISEALGYKVDWNAETKAITIEDEYIQKATLRNGATTIVFESKLQFINMDREIETEVPIVIHNGYTYVPLDFFEEFLNDTTVVETLITITPSQCEINSNIK